MDTSKRSEALITLGKRLVEELSLPENDRETLARWMAHDIADKILRAETTEEVDRDAANLACVDAILNLWDHRSAIPEGRRPMLDAEKADRILRRLDPNADEGLLFRVQDFGPTGDNPWLQRAIEIDKASRAMLRACVRMAARGDDDKAKHYAELAESAGLASGPDTLFTRRVLLGGPDDQPEPHEKPLRESKADLASIRPLGRLTREITRALKDEQEELRDRG